MKFSIDVKDQPLAEDVTKVEFYLKKNANGSIGLRIINSAIPDEFTDVELLTIGTDGVIRRNFFKSNTDYRAFMQYEMVGGINKPKVL